MSSALESSTSYAAALNTTADDCSPDDATRSIGDGSALEDNFFKDEGGFRQLNHFYDPITGRGLSELPVLPNRLIGQNSFTWASSFNCPGVDWGGVAGIAFRNVGKFNTWSWRNARDYQLFGLTTRERSDRHDALVNMFRSVGQVMHLLQDASQPQHVRNEQHLPFLWFYSRIEAYGTKNAPRLNHPRSAQYGRGREKRILIISPTCFADNRVNAVAWLAKSARPDSQRRGTGNCNYASCPAKRQFTQGVVLKK
jgi:hypothetical protein